MVNEYILPRDLPAADEVFSDAKLVVDDGNTVQSATPKQIVDAGRPVASEPQAIDGTDNETAMTPLTTRQAIDADTSGTVAAAEAARDKAQEWAESPTAPGDPGTKSSKTWAGEASDSAAAAASYFDSVPSKRIMGRDSAGTGMAEYLTATQARSVMGLGTAATADVQSSPTDTGADKLMKVGAFGLGGRAPSLPNDDVDDIDARESGIYRITPTDVNWTSPQPYAHIITMRQGGGVNTSEIAVDILGRLYTRGRSAGGINKWRRYFHEDNILGTVSQSAGTPTGAIIERGSNPNGEFVKYADGTQICWITGDFTRYTNNSLQYVGPPPAAFRSNSDIHASVAVRDAGTAVTDISLSDLGVVRVNPDNGNVFLQRVASAPNFAVGAIVHDTKITLSGRWF